MPHARWNLAPFTALLLAPCAVGAQGTPQSVTVSGVVRDDSNRSVIGATVTLMRTQMFLTECRCDRSGRFGRSGPDGRFRFVGVPRDQSWTLTVVAVGYAPWSVSFLPTAAEVELEVRMALESKADEERRLALREQFRRTFTAESLPRRAALPIVGAHLGAPLGLSAAIGGALVIHRNVNPADNYGLIERIAFADVEPGIHGFRASAGFATYYRFIPGSNNWDTGGAVGLRASFLQRGYGVAPGRFVGVEASMWSLPFPLSLRAGAFVRVRGSDRRKLLFTFDFPVGF